MWKHIPVGKHLNNYLKLQTSLNLSTVERLCWQNFIGELSKWRSSLHSKRPVLPESIDPFLKQKAALCYCSHLLQLEMRQSSEHQHLSAVWLHSQEQDRSYLPITGALTECRAKGVYPRAVFILFFTQSGTPLTFSQFPEKVPSHLVCCQAKYIKQSIAISDPSHP